MSEVVLVRHGETEWSRSKRHTGRTDVELTDAGRRDAERLRPVLAGRRWARVLCSPRERARETCRLAGGGDDPEIVDDLREWDYGDFEGRTSAQIRERVPGWTIWRGPVAGGESLADVGRRADRLVAELRDAPGDVAVFAHGHIGRVLAARWLDLPAGAGAHLIFATGRYGVLGWEHETPALAGWNLLP